MRGPGVRVARAGWFPPLLAAILVALVAGVVLTITHHQPRPVVPPRVAVRAALHDQQTTRLLAGSHWNRITVDSLDDQIEHVTFFADGRLVLSDTVYRGLTVTLGQNGRAETVPYGDWIAYEPMVLVALCALFALMACVSPWRRVRNLDVAACISLLAPVLLLQHEYIEASVVSALPGMVYLFLRLAYRAFAPARPAAPQQPLLAVVTPGVDRARRVRWLRVLLAVLAAVFLMVGVSSPAAVDVLYATMQGATTLIHGVLPYGHLPPGVVHGDTYPILTYALYAPVALFAPVGSPWGASVDAGLAVAVLAALAGAWAIFSTISGRRTSERPSLSLESEEAGLRAAVAFLTFPSLLITVSTGTTDVVLATMLAVALVLWRRPAACSAMLAVGGWFKVVPFVLLPIPLASMRGRKLIRALAVVALVSLPPLILLLALGGLHGPLEMIRAVSFQFSRGSLQSAWSQLGITRLQPVAQGCVLGLLAAAVVKLRREPTLHQDRARMAALMGALLIGLQLAADYWAFLYLVWIAPVLSASLLIQGDAPAPAAESIPQPIPRLRPSAELAGDMPR